MRLRARSAALSRGKLFFFFASDAAMRERLCSVYVRLMRAPPLLVIYRRRARVVPPVATGGHASSRVYIYDGSACLRCARYAGMVLVAEGTEIREDPRVTAFSERDDVVDVDRRLRDPALQAHHAEGLHAQCCARSRRHCCLS